MNLILKKVESYDMIMSEIQKLKKCMGLDRVLDRDFEQETDPELKDQKFEKMLSAKSETIRKRGELERKMFEQQEEQEKQ